MHSNSFTCNKCLAGLGLRDRPYEIFHLFLTGFRLPESFKGSVVANTFASHVLYSSFCLENGKAFKVNRLKCPDNSHSQGL